MADPEDEPASYDPSRDPPGRGFWLSIAVVVATFGALFIAAWLSGAL